MTVSALIIELILVAVLYILEVLGYWKLFEKMGIPGWKALIPFYNIYLRYQKTWRTKFFWAALVLGIAKVITGYFSGSLAVSFGWVLGFFATYIEISSMFRLAKCFGKGIGYSVGLCFLCPFFMMGLGFGTAQYLGNIGNPDKLW